jgi:hypothetical protein
VAPVPAPALSSTRLQVAAAFLDELRFSRHANPLSMLMNLEPAFVHRKQS